LSTGRSLQASLRAKPPKPTAAERRGLAARNRLVVEHLEWARGIARSVAARLPTWFVEEDLVGPAEIGLIQAAERYDRTRNDNFRAYAQRRVFGACIQSVRRREYRERASITLIEDVHTHPGDRPDAEAQEAITLQRMWRRVRELPKANARVIRAHYLEDMTLVEIAGQMGVSESWVCRLHRDGLGMLRGRCRDMEDLAA